MLDVNQQCWDNYLEFLEVNHASDWQATGEFLSPLNPPLGIVHSPEGKAEVLANSVEEKFTPHRGVFNATTWPT